MSFTFHNLTMNSLTKDLVIQCVSYLLFNFSYMKFCLSYVVSYLLPGIGAFLQKCPYQVYDRKVWQSQLKILKILAKYSILGWIDRNQIWNLFLNIWNIEIYIFIMFFIPIKKKNVKKCLRIYGRWFRTQTILSFTGIFWQKSQMMKNSFEILLIDGITCNNITITKHFST